MEMLLGFCHARFGYCSSVWCSAADIHTLIKLLDRVAGGAVFYGWCVCVRHCTSSICSSIMYDVQHQVQPDAPSLWCSTYRPYVPVRVIRGAYAPPRCRTSQYRRSLFPCQHFCGTILVTIYSMVWDRRVSRTGSMPFYFPSYTRSIFSRIVFPFFSFILWVGIVGLGSSD